MKRALVAALFLSGCTEDQPESHALPPDPIAFFTGDSHGEGDLWKAIKGDRQIRVASRGTVRRDGSLTLLQTIAEDGKARQRTWVMRKVAEGRWTGSLTDAIGPVDVRAENGALRIAYEMKHGLQVRQALGAIDDCTIDNILRVSKWGLTVARLHETIRRASPPCTMPPPR